ncbi:hypothetical protein pb186bvf_007451 [Paramecium bursaria]
MNLPTEQNHEQYEINSFQNEEQKIEIKKSSSINPNSINDSQIQNDLFNMLEEQKVSGLLGYQLISQNLQFGAFMPMDKFLKFFEEWIEQMKQMEENQLNQDEKEAYIYMKHNLFRILLQSLQMYLLKGNTLNLGEIEDRILDWSTTNQRNFINFRELIFSNPLICETICNYVEQKFLDNLPSDVEHIHYFQRFWEDYAYPKLRQFKRDQPRRPLKTNYCKIQQWDQVYYKVVELIINSNSNPSNILSEIQKQQQSNLIQVQQEIQMLQQPQQIKLIQQNQNDRQILQQQQGQEQSEQQRNLQSQNDQQQYDQNQLKQKINDNQILLMKNLKPKKLQVTISEIPDHMRLKKATQILGELIYIDLRYQILQGIELENDLQDFYNMIDANKNQNDYSCDQKNLIQLYGTTAGQNYLQNFLDNQLSERLITKSKKEFGLLAIEIKKIRQSMIQKNSKKKQ